MQRATLLLAASLLFTVIALAPVASADPCGIVHCTVWEPGVCTWNKGACGPLDIVCVTLNGHVVACATWACNTQSECTWPPQIHLCGDPCY